MKNLSIKDILIHIMPGGIILATVYFALHSTLDNYDKITENLPFLFNKEGAVTGFGGVVILIACYLVGLLLDPFSDWIDTKRKKHCVPSYYLLKNGKCYQLRLPHYRKIRKLLKKDVKKTEK
jgi:prolipoprotein diacylglyceryltransferase